MTAILISLEESPAGQLIICLIVQLKQVKRKMKTEVSIPVHRDRGYYHLSHIQIACQEPPPSAPTGFSHSWYFEARKPFILSISMLLYYLMSLPHLNLNQLAPSSSQKQPKIPALPMYVFKTLLSELLLPLINRHQRDTKKYEGRIAILELVVTSLCSQ